MCVWSVNLSPHPEVRSSFLCISWIFDVTRNVTQIFTNFAHWKCPGINQSTFRKILTVSVIAETNVVLLETVYYPCHNVESGVIADPFRKKLKCIDDQLKTSLSGQEVKEILIKQEHL